MTTPNTLALPKSPTPKKRAPQSIKNEMSQIWDLVETWDFHKNLKPVVILVLYTAYTFDLPPKFPGKPHKKPLPPVCPQPPTIYL